MVSSLIRNQVPACRLRVRVPCPPLPEVLSGQGVLDVRSSPFFRSLVVNMLTGTQSGTQTAVFLSRFLPMLSP